MTSTPKPPHGGDDEESTGDRSSTPKQHLLDFVRQLPADATYEELLERTVEKLEYTRQLEDMVERAEQDIEEGRTVPHEEAKKRFGIE